jgi:gliding motility-associated-like protein
MRKKLKKYSLVAFIILSSFTLFTAHQSNAQLYPASFDVTTLNGTNGFVIPGIQASSKFGAETKFVGDINNDGFEDIGVGVLNTQINDSSQVGTTYVIFGSDIGFPASFDVTSLNGTNGFIFEGIRQYEGIGLSIAGVGDINGDGIDDLVIGASRFAEGSVVLYGKPNGSAFNAVMNRNDIDGSNGFIIVATGVSQQVNDLGALGDVNGDGYNDFIMGKAAGGEAWVFFGRSTNFPTRIDASWLDGVKGFRISSYPNSLRTSYLVGGAGDINNDGFNDIIVGDWSITNGSFIERTHLIFGKSTFTTLVNAEPLDGTNGFTIEHTGGSSLAFVGTLGDINNDGIDDFFSEQSAIFGKDQTDPFPANIPLSSVTDRTYGFILPGTLTSASIGDVNLDGINDFISVSGSAAHVVFGSTTVFPNPLNATTLDGNNGFVIEGLLASNIGRPVSGNGDINGDGISDFIVGDLTPPLYTGAVYVVFGGDHYAQPLNTSYPQAINETGSGFTLVANGSEVGTVHYAIFPGSFTSSVDHDVILNGTGAITQGSFAMSSVNTDVQELISSLTASTAYDVYLFLEDTLANQGDIYNLNDVTTQATACPYTVPCAERDALIALYNATDGANWATNTNWLTTNPVDDWFGVTVTNGHVTGIEFYWYGNNLNGIIPTEIENLPYLEVLKMPGNGSLTGSIPEQLYTLLNLKTIELDYCDLSGSLSPNIKNLTVLEILILGNNRLTGIIPSGIADLTQLRQLELDSNQFSGVIPAGIYTLTNLEVLNLYSNSLSGPISADIKNLTRLTTLSLGENPIGGNIPIGIGDLTKLTTLNIYNASLTGTIPTEIGNLVNLQYLQLSSNQLSGSIPSSLGNLTQLVSLYLNSNSLTGAIPPSLGKLINVQLFILGNNQLTGAIPPELGMLESVTSFYLYNNNLSGTIPTELGGLTSVDQLYLSDNQLEGAIPASLASLPNVTDIAFDNNNLSGTVPDFTQAPSLDYRIYIRNNAFQFGDFEDQWDDYQIQLYAFYDSPQANVNLEETINVNIGNSTTLTTTVSGSQNNYQWYKNNTLINGAISSTLVLNNVQLTDAGDYHCVITSNIVTDLTLRRNVIHLNVTALDTVAPIISCPADQELTCVDTVIPDYTSLAVVSDNLDPTPLVIQNPVAGTAFTSGMSITLTATDASSNSSTCTFNINEALDAQAPTITCPVDQELAFGATLPDYTGLAITSDNCDSNPIVTQLPAIGSAFTNGMTVTLTATDVSGKASTCGFVIYEIDTQAPVINCPANQELTCVDSVIPDYTSLVVVGDNLDPSPSVAQSPVAGTAFTGGMTITLTATDASSNSSTCTFNINEALDTQAPTISCPANQELAKGTSLPDYTGLAIVTDNCDTSPDITQSPVAGSAFTDGMAVTLTATDATGNESTCSIIVNETDTEAPTITCSANQELTCSDKVMPDYTSLAMVTDNKDPNPVITQSPVTGSAFTDGMSVTLTATDASGNFSTCTLIVNEIPDTQAPTITCPATQELAFDATIPDYTGLAIVTDNCDNNPVITQLPVVGSAFTNGMTVTLTVMDVSGNANSCAFILNQVPDTENPEITCLANQELTCADTVIPDYTSLVTVTDNEDPNPTIAQSPLAGTVFTNGMAITLTATDASGNFNNCTFIVNMDEVLSIEAGNDLTIIQGESIQLHVASNMSGTYKWSPSTSLNVSDSASPIASPEQTTTYEVIFTSIDGCIGKDELTIFVEETEGIHKNKYGFSPDNDGINEVWKINEIEKYPNNLVAIYNRWGDKVFEMNNYDNASKVFNGMANQLKSLGAADLPEGTYFFKIDLKNEESPVSGYLVIKR